MEYKDCKDPTVRLKLDSETEAECKNKKDCTNSRDVINKFEKIYTNKSTALQILCRVNIDDIKLKDYDTVEDFFIYFEKAVNEFK